MFAQYSQKILYVSMTGVHNLIYGGGGEGAQECVSGGGVILICMEVIHFSETPYHLYICITNSRGVMFCLQNVKGAISTRLFILRFISYIYI